MRDSNQAPAQVSFNHHVGQASCLPPSTPGDANMPRSEINERDLGTLGSPTSGSARSHARSCAIMLGLTVLVLGALGLGARWWADYVWSRNREQIRQDLRNVEPLLTALEMYRADHDDYPPKLDALTPEYIASIAEPPFDFTAQFGWEYSADPEMVNAWIEEQPANRGFEQRDDIYHLYVTVPSDYSPLYGLFQDRLVYRPNEQYPVVGYGGALERIAGWGYYHE